MSIPYYSDDFVTLYHGDCREVTAWLEADVLVTDPPYGRRFQSHKPSHLRGEFNEIANDRDTLARDAILAAWPTGRPALVFGSWKCPRPAATHTLLTWDKGPAFGMGDLSVPWKPNTEEIYVIGKGFSGTRDGSVLHGFSHTSWATNGRDHPNMKPTTLMEALLVKTGGVVADPFAGSGSTLVAAKNLGRKAIGVEIDERYCEVAAKRLCQDLLDFVNAI